MEKAAPAAGDGLTQASTREETTHMPPTAKAVDHNHVEGDIEGDAGGPTDTIGSSDKNSPMNSASQKPSGTHPLNNVSGETSILATVTTTSGSSQHLEAYYLCPHIETNNDFAKMLYRIEHLLLGWNTSSHKAARPQLLHHFCYRQTATHTAWTYSGVYKDSQGPAHCGAFW
jgi:hypothetical protein